MLLPILFSFVVSFSPAQQVPKFEKTAITTPINEEYYSLTLKNKSAKSIPLRIPGVMNPNLSPFSNSGVSLKVGQKVFFRVDGKKYLLFEMSKEYADQTIEVSSLIKKRKKELGLK